MICDGCDAHYHMSCLGMTAMPVCDWFCPNCCSGDAGGGECCSPCSSEPSPLTKLRQQRIANKSKRGGGKLVQGRKRLRQ